MKVDSNTYIFSDPHYGHKNFVAGETEWFFDPNRTEEEIKELRWRRCRPFHTLEAMNVTIVDGINSMVPENATLICLGDWSFGGIENIWNFRKQIKCKDIHLILGNHDHHIENNKVLPNCHFNDEDEIVDGEPPVRYGDSRDDLFKVHAQELFTSVSHYKELRYKEHGQVFDIILSHYAMRSWNKVYKGSIMLYGHSHGTLGKMTPEIANPQWIGDEYYARNYRTQDVGMDTNNLKPYYLKDIIDNMKTRPVGIEIDHDANRPKYSVDNKDDIGLFGKPKGV